jgi:hypothetical protein
LVPNLFHGYEAQLRRITNPDIHEVLVLFSKIDEPYVIRGSGSIQSAGVSLATLDVDMQLPTSLGTRHMADAAGATLKVATAVRFRQPMARLLGWRAFRDGGMVLQMDLDVPYGPVMLDGKAYWRHFRKAV